jgi:hypothetical protein
MRSQQISLMVSENLLQTSMFCIIQNLPDMYIGTQSVRKEQQTDARFRPSCCSVMQEGQEMRKGGPAD